MSTRRHPMKDTLLMALLVAGAILWGASAQALDRNDIGFHAGFRDGLKADVYGDPWRKAREDFGFYEDDVEFKGIWKTGGLVKGQTEDILAAAYVRAEAGKALIVVVNRDKEPRTPTLIVDAAGLGLKRATRLTNAETGVAIPATADANGAFSLKVEIPDRDYVLMLAE